MAGPGGALGPMGYGVARWLVDERWTLAVFITALLVRVHWNLVAHPPGDFIYSDMSGYISRADQAMRDPWAPREYSGFYPWGTHVLIAGLQMLFGKANWPAVGSVFALMGALVATFGFLVARRTSRARWVAPAVGLVLVCDYPLISLGGYFLSEIPFALGLTIGTWGLLRMVDHGRVRDAWIAGSAIAFAFVMRPQILASVALLFVLWLCARKVYPKLRVALLVHAAIPIALAMGFSAVRLHHHTERWGLICENGLFNQVFGRCHCTVIFALPDGKGHSRTTFGPPPLIQMRRLGVKTGEWPQLDPVLDVNLYFFGYIADREIMRGYIDQCIEKSGWLKQAEFALVHVLMLWKYNVLWPDSGSKGYRSAAETWRTLHNWTVAIPAVLVMFVAFVPRRHPKLAVVALHLWAVLIVAALYFGDARLRAPYDPIIVLLAFEGVAAVASWIARRRRKREPGP